MELYGSIRTLLDSSLRPVSWTELVLELRSGVTMDAEMEEREKLEDAMMQKAMVAALEEAESESLSSSDRLLPLSHTLGDDLNEVEKDDQPQEHGDHMNTVAVDSAIQNIELSKQTLDWWKRAHGQYKDMFRRRMDSLTAGRRSYALSKRLQGSDLPLFESKLYGHRILWSLVKRDAVPSVLVWCVSTHNDVSRRIGLINRSFARMAQHRNASAAVETVRWIAVADDEVLLDPFSNAPMKLFEARADELAVSVASKWSPPLLLSAKQREINSQRGSVLLLGRSGTGKTYYLVNRMQSDARAAVEASAGAAAADTAFRQLCVTRSAKLCELLKSLYRDGEENSALSQRADFRTLEQFISHMEKVCGATAGAASGLPFPFPKNRNVDFACFRDTIFPTIAGKDRSLDALTVWTQIRSFLKGSVEAVLLGRPLQLKEYLDLDTFGKNRCRLPKDERRKAFRLFEQYEKELRVSGMWDDCDRILDLLKKCDLKERLPLAGCVTDELGTRNYDRVYMDEVQDCTQAEICLFIVAVGLQFQSLFLVGDPAQAVVEGVDFRFEDVRSIVFQLSKGRESLDRPTTLAMNYRSHKGILNYAEKIIDVLDAAFPGSAKKMFTECRAQGPRPAYYMSNSSTGVDLTDVLAMNERLVVLCRDEISSELRTKTRASALGIREAKGLEFAEVVLVDFFAGIRDSDQKEWKQLLTEDKATKQQQQQQQSRWSPQLETQLKLLYTASTRSQNRLTFFETKSSVAGLAFFSWLQAQQLAEPLEISQDAEKRSLMTSDEWRARGLDFAVSAEGSSAVLLLREAVRCFERAKDFKLSRRASAELEFHLMMQRLAEASSRSGGSDRSGSQCMAPSEEKEAAQLMEKLIESQLHSHAKSLSEVIQPICCDPEKFHSLIASRLVSLVNSFLME